MAELSEEESNIIQKYIVAGFMAVREKFASHTPDQIADAMTLAQCSIVTLFDAPLGLPGFDDCAELVRRKMTLDSERHLYAALKCAHESLARGIPRSENDILAAELALANAKEHCNA